MMAHQHCQAASQEPRHGETPDRRGRAGERWLRAILIAFVLATCLRVWLGPIDVLPPARAQIPDAGLQRREQIDTQLETNRLLGEILATLQTGTLNVRSVGTDKTGAAPSVSAPAARPLTPGVKGKSGS